MLKIIKYYLFVLLCVGFALFQEQESINEKEQLAQFYIEAGLYDDAIFIYKNVLDLKKDILGKYNLELMSFLYSLSDLYALKEDFKTSQDYLKEALDIQYLNFLLYQKKYIPTLNKYKDMYSIASDSTNISYVDSLITLLSSINFDSTYNAFDSS